MKSLLWEFLLFHNLKIFDKRRNLLQMGGQRGNIATTQLWICQYKAIMIGNKQAGKQS